MGRYFDYDGRETLKSRGVDKDQSLYVSLHVS